MNQEQSAFKPLLFVAMPFGEKKVPSAEYTIDFDAIYTNAIIPAAKAPTLDLEIIRADEEHLGGIIHVAMFERLLLSEIVIADLTLANANVFYELGVRHAAKPFTTILMYAKGERLPFDVSPLRAISYELIDGSLSTEEGERLKQVLVERLEKALEDTSFDSPLFQLIANYTGVSLTSDQTDSFRDRVKMAESFRTQIEEAKQDIVNGKERLSAIKESLGDLKNTPHEITIEILLGLRDLMAWSEMIQLCQEMPLDLHKTILVQEQKAFALNRLGKREEATTVLKSLITEFGESSETCGLLGRVYKDQYKDAKNTNKPILSKAALQESIKYYRQGFTIDPRDHYPGINAVTLLSIRGNPEDLEELQTLRPAVLFAVNRRGGMDSSDFWDIATLLQLHILDENWSDAKETAARMRLLNPPPMALQSEIESQNLLRQVRIEKGLSTEDLDEVISILQES